MTFVGHLNTVKTDAICTQHPEQVTLGLLEVCTHLNTASVTVLSRLRRNHGLGAPIRVRFEIVDSILTDGKTSLFQVSVGPIRVA